ncbi:hypothetical protein RJ639_008801 [Escallonia herrerae]|uniref:Disease resistance protein RPM1 n=1 Tax=Escallonia herrerae TaxID=1293975 RepID=A0AA88VXG0_9ASTE|nr:hypothetical protein RJ639_008801 [Escallonia herrerae]
MEAIIAGHVINKILSILEYRVLLVGGVYEELDELRLELDSMRSFLEDADQKKNLTEGEKTWVKTVKDMCYPIENVLDEFMYHMSKPQSRGKFAKILQHASHFPKNLWVRHQVATKLRKINRKIKAISERRGRYPVQLEETRSIDDHRRLQYHGEALSSGNDDHLVGIEGDRCLLLKWLTCDEPRRAVMSVVGMGGSGKSTLVSKVYNSPVVKQHFKCYAWIRVSPAYNIEDIFRSMIKKFHGQNQENLPLGLSSMGCQELLEMLVDYLRSKRYILVLDDVWARQLLDVINASLPDEGLGSRVMLTTRSHDIASFPFGVVSHVHDIKPLGRDDAWDLFRVKAFSKATQNLCPAELEQTARSLVARCEGLPLAILALGGVMSSKILLSEWIDFSGSLTQELGNNTGLELMNKILWLSFHHLPFQLKCCFLYCCLFPTGYKIRRKRLIRLWMAEGFVKQVQGKTPECLAEDYLMELIHRNMLQVVQKNQSGRPKACKMHDLMRELALIESPKEFCAVYNGQEASKETSTPRRLSIAITSPRATKSFNGISELGSLFVFVANTLSPSSAVTLPSGFKLLRVLDLQDVRVEKLHDEVVNLFNLRYLNLRRTKVKELPKSFGRLSNLQTLDIRDSEIEALPSGVAKMQNLRHLIMYRHSHNIDDFCFVTGTRALPSVCKLKNLQVIASIEGGPEFLRELKNMTQLTRIGITKVKEAYADDLCIAIQSMELLQHLFVTTSDEEEYLDINAISPIPPRLRRIVLSGKLEKVPRWFDSLQCLTSLTLQGSRLRVDLLPYINTLASLGKLVLCDAYAGSQLCFSSGFSKLQQLILRSLPHLNAIIIEKGVMPSLRRLWLGNCPKLKMLPLGIEHLPNLKQLDLDRVQTELIDSIRSVESVDRHKVQGIPEINHYHQSESGISYESLSGLDLQTIKDQFSSYRDDA